MHKRYFGHVAVIAAMFLIIFFCFPGEREKKGTPLPENFVSIADAVAATHGQVKYYFFETAIVFYTELFSPESQEEQIMELGSWVTEYNVDRNYIYLFSISQEKELVQTLAK